MLKYGESVRLGAEDTRERILCAAREVFVRYGTRGTTTREIAERAGVNEATLFRKFGTKQALLDAMKEHFCDAEGLATVLEGLSGDVERDLQTIALKALRNIDGNRQMICIGMAEEALDGDDAGVTWRGPVQIKARLERYFASRVEAGELYGDPRALTRVFLGTLLGYVLPRRFIDDQTPHEAIAATCVGIFLNGVRTHRGPA